MDSEVVELDSIERRIIHMRGTRVIIDADLATMYGVSTKRLNEQVRRNIDRFPADFMFQLTSSEKSKVVAICDHLAQLRYTPAFPLAFTEHGAIMAASVLNSTQAVEVSILVVRAFVRMRQMIGMVSDLAERMDELESRYDDQFKAVFQAIRSLMEPAPVEPPRQVIGFHTRVDKSKDEDSA